MKKLHSILITVCACAALATLAGCGSSDTKTDESEIINTSSTAPSNPEIFRLGSADAQKMLDKCRSISQIELELLDVKARIHLIESRFDKQAAEDYTKGFKAYIRENNDSLSAILFD